jgi:hypothetical protein
MIRQTSLATASALLLLATTAIPTRAAHAPANRTKASAMRPSGSMTQAMHYFNAINQARRTGTSNGALHRMYTAHIILTESLTTGRPVVHTGIQSVRAFDVFNSLSWSVLQSRQLSPTVVLTIEQPSVRGPGHELDHARPWLTLITIKRGQITNLVWMPC